MGYRTRRIHEEERSAHAVLLEMLKQLTAAIKQAERHSEESKVEPLISKLRELHARSEKEVVERHWGTWTSIAGESQLICLNDALLNAAGHSFRRPDETVLRGDSRHDRDKFRSEVSLGSPHRCRQRQM